MNFWLRKTPHAYLPGGGVLGTAANATDCTAHNIIKYPATLFRQIIVWFLFTANGPRRIRNEEAFERTPALSPPSPTTRPRNKDRYTTIRFPSRPAASASAQQN